MRKVILLILLIPFASSAQVPAEKNLAEKNNVVSARSKTQAKERLEIYRQRVLKGESMSTLAALYSEDPGSAANGGRYDGIERGQFVPEFEAAAFSLMPGEISEIFETQYGFHFVQLIARRGNVVDVRHILVCPK
ncbi:MAG: peptidylprolyl isomerase [Bacteroidia bacterium]